MWRHGSHGEGSGAKVFPPRKVLSDGDAGRHCELMWWWALSVWCPVLRGGEGGAEVSGC